MQNSLEYSQQVVSPVAQRTSVRVGRWAAILGRSIVSASLMIWVLRGTDFSAVWQSFSRANLLILPVAFSLSFLGYFISVTRWRLLLRTQGVIATRLFLVKSFMVGLFFNNVLPSTIGGDIVRTYDSARLGMEKMAALAVIVVERFLGVLALASVALAALVVSGSLQQNIFLPYLFIIGGLFFAVLVIAVLVQPRSRVAGFVTSLLTRLPSSLQRLVRKVADSFLVFRTERQALRRAFALSLALQCNVVLQYYLIGKALQFPVSIGTFFLIIPLALFVMLVPISINAVGVREGVFVFLLGQWGLPKADALVLAWLAYLFLLLQGLLGGIVYALRK